MIQTILFAYDFSPSAERALAYGVDLVERTDATMHLMYVRETPQSPLQNQKRSPAPSYKLRTEFQERCAEALARHGLSADDDRLSFNVEQNDAVAPTLLRTAEQRDVDLVLMGTHGRRGMQRALYGSVAEEVLRRAPCAVYITRAQDEADSGGERTAVNRIVAPIDFSEASKNALRYVAQLAPLYDATVKLLHVVESPKMPPVYDTESPKVTSRTTTEQAREVLKEWGQAALEVGREGDSYVVHRGDPAPTILGAAPNPDDLVVMATRGLSGLQRAMLGSVTEAVIRDAPGPVLASRSFPDQE